MGIRPLIQHVQHHIYPGADIETVAKSAHEIGIIGHGRGKCLVFNRDNGGGCVLCLVKVAITVNFVFSRHHNCRLKGIHGVMGHTHHRGPRIHNLNIPNPATAVTLNICYQPHMTLLPQYIAQFQTISRLILNQFHARNLIPQSGNVAGLNAQSVMDEHTAHSAIIGFRIAPFQPLGIKVRVGILQSCHKGIKADIIRHIKLLHACGRIGQALHLHPGREIPILGRQVHQRRIQNLTALLGIQNGIQHADILRHIGTDTQRVIYRGTKQGAVAEILGGNIHLNTVNQFAEADMYPRFLGNVNGCRGVGDSIDTVSGFVVILNGGIGPAFFQIYVIGNIRPQIQPIGSINIGRRIPMSLRGVRIALPQCP